MTVKERLIGSFILLLVIFLVGWRLPIGQITPQYLPLARVLVGLIGLVIIIVYNGLDGVSTTKSKEGKGE